MSMSRYLRRQLKRWESISHSIDLPWTLGAVAVLGLLYYILDKGEIPWGDLTKLGVFVGFAALFGLSILWRVLRRRWASGIVSSKKWSPKLLDTELAECGGTYLFVGNSFKPHLDTFLKKYSQDAYGKKKVCLVLAKSGGDTNLAQEHLEVIEALKVFRIEFRTMKHPKLWWAHVFNEQDEEQVSILVGLDAVDGNNPATVLELERIPNRYSLFEHFLTEARNVYSMSDVKTAEIWSRDLKDIVGNETKMLR